MVDFLLGIFFVFLFFRGWARGFVKEAMDLLGVLVGLAVAFRLSPAAGAIVGGIVGSSPTVSRILGGLILFVLVGGVAALGAHYLHKVARLPGLALGNRVTGAGLALAWGAFIATLILSVASLLRLPAAVAAGIDESAVAATLTDPAGVPQTVFASVAGDRVMGVLLSLEDLVGGRRAIVEGSDRVEFEPAEAEVLETNASAAVDLFEAVNESRSEAGMKPLSWSKPFARVAQAHAEDMYRRGYFSHQSPETGTVVNRLSRAGLAANRAGENIALAADPVEAHAGLVESAGHYENLINPGYSTVGIAAVSGPLGLMVVQVFGG
ncbi:MAG: hypothetical protein HKN74_14585 [Acidimicrobiia bacterium]|nr:CvpA family protein [Acidimicrobiia bacterium]NNF11500.1 hypothetical protein [Acidimicrobiia bacterium]NNL68910.1 hypothetical protein [Acidimicrobiia bacterium]